jgi:hypothetical protein
MNKLILLAAFLLASAPTWACSCIAEDVPEAHKITKSFQRATLVFAGRVVKAEPVPAATAPDAAALPMARVRYTFAVKRLYKGEQVDSTVVLETPAQSAACGVSFTVGSEHLLYANTTGPAASPGQPRYAISLCDRHQALSNVKASELRQLKQMAYKASGEHRFTWFELGD